MTEAAPPAPVDRRTAWKIVATVIVVMGAVGSLLYASTKEGAQYYMHVDEALPKLPTLQGKRLQIHGHVANGSIEKRKNTLDYRFVIESRPPRAPGTMTASYSGIVPDTFKDGAEVVATGMLAPDGSLKVAADGIQAKCPSKYEANKPGSVPKNAGMAPVTN
jgi:cytochrome c-type biogenesis protein CcmE